MVTRINDWTNKTWKIQNLNSINRKILTPTVEFKEVQENLMVTIRNMGKQQDPMELIREMQRQIQEL